MRARDSPKFLRPMNAGEQHEILHRAFVGAAAPSCVMCGRPLGFKSFSEISDRWSTAFMCPAF